MNEFGKHALDLLLREDPEMEFKIDRNIEMYRKGFGTIRLRKADVMSYSFRLFVR